LLAVECWRGLAQRDRQSVLHGTSSAPDHLASGDVVVRTQGDPRTERRGVGELRKVRPDFGDDRLRRQRIDTRHRRQIRSQHAIAMRAQVEMRAIAAASAFAPRLRQWLLLGVDPVRQSSNRLSMG
jgi:hypothetical protein